MVPVKFLLDENVSGAVLLVLTRAGHAAVMSRNYVGKGVADKDLLAVAADEGWTVITCDPGFWYLARGQEKSAGAVLLKLKNLRPENQVKAVRSALEKGLVVKGKPVVCLV
jgi:predicted nuclease of predicted toxin-antitoxin system